MKGRVPLGVRNMGGAFVEQNLPGSTQQKIILEKIILNVI